MRLVRKFLGCDFQVGNLVKFKEHKYPYIYRVAEVRFVDHWEIRVDDSPLWVRHDKLELLYARDNHHLHQRVRTWEEAHKRLIQTIKKLKGK